MDTLKNPYIGPRTFQRNEGHLFFGREREARDLISLVASERLVVFYAQSGAGKSSIVNTRLIPNLEEKEYEVLPVGRVSGDSGEGLEVNNIYIYNLLRSLEQHDVDLSHFGTLTLAQFLCQLNYDDKGFFYDPALPDSVPASEDETVIRRALIIDQFEELFSTHPEAWEKREGFFAQVAQAMQDDPHLWVVLVMREDYIAALDPYAHLVSNGLRVRYYMQRLGREAGLKAVKSPVEEIRPYAAGVAEKLIDDLCSIKVQQPDGTLDVQPGQYVEPVQMQVVCYGLWDNLSPDGTQITEQDLQDVGDVNQSLGKYYDRRVGEVAKAKNVRERMIREWFEKKLITAGGIRNMVLQEREPKPGELNDDVIQALQSDLVRGEKRGGATWYELTHDRLVEPILERNKIWFSENLSPLQRQAALWKDQDQNESWLLRDQALVEVQEWAEDHKDELTDTEQEFLTACQKSQAQIDERHAAERNRLEMANRLAEEQTRSAKRARTFNVVSGMLVIVAVIASLLALQSRSDALSLKVRAEGESTKAVEAQHTAVAAQQIAQQQAERALAGDLISLSDDSENEGKADLAALLRIEAYHAKVDARTRKSLLLTLQDLSGLNGLLNPQADRVFFNPNGRVMAALDNKGGITLWDITRRQKINPTPINIQLASPVYPIVFSPDGTLLASASQDASMVLWDAATGKQLSDPRKEHTLWIDGLAFNPTNNILATCSDDRTVILWDISKRDDPQRISVLSGFADWVGNVKFSPDGILLATSDSSGFIKFWNIKDPKSPAEFATLRQGTPNTYGMEFNKDGSILAAVSYDGSINLWDVNHIEDPEPKYISIRDPDGQAYLAMSFSPDGKTLAARTNTSITLWNVRGPSEPDMIGKPLAKYAGVALSNNSVQYLSNIAFSPDGKTLVSSGCNLGCNIYMWDISKLASPSEMGPPIHVAVTINTIAFSRDGNILATGNYDGSILRWDMTGKEPSPIAPLLNGHPGQTDRVEFSPDGNILSVHGTFGNPVLLDIATLTEIGISANNPAYIDFGNGLFQFQYYDDTTGQILSQIVEAKTGERREPIIPGLFVAISPSKRIIVYRTIDKKGQTNLNLWDVTQGESIVTEIEGEFLGFSGDSKILAYQQTGSNGQQYLRLLDSATGESVSSQIHGSFIPYAFNNKVLIYQDIDDNGGPQISVWKIDDDKIEDQLPGSFHSISGDGRFLAYLNQNEFSFVDTATGKPIGTPTSGALSSFYGSESILAYTYTTEQSLVGLLKLDTGELSTLPASITAVSPDGQKLIYQVTNSNSENSIAALDMLTGETSAFIHPIVTHLTFSPDNQIWVYQTLDPKTNKYYFGFLNLATGIHIDTFVAGNFAGFSKDSKILAYQAYDADGKPSVGLLDVSSGVSVGSPQPGTYMDFTDDGQYVVYQTVDNKAIGLIDGATGKSTGMMTIRGDYHSYIKPANLFASIDQGIVNFMDMPRSWMLGVPLDQQPAAPIERAALDSGATMLASTNENSNLFLQSLETNSKPFTFANRHAGGLRSLVFNSRGSEFLTAGFDSKIFVWGWDRNSKPIPMNTDPINGTRGLFSPDGKILIIADENKNVTSFLSFDKFVVLKQLSGVPICTVDAEGSKLVISDSTTGISTLWNVDTLEQIGEPIAATNARFTDSCNFLISEDQENNLTTLFNLVSQNPKGDAVTGTSSVSSPDGNTITTIDSKTNQLLAWNLTAQGPQAIKIHNSPQTSGGSPIFSPTGKFLVVWNASDTSSGSLNLVWSLGAKNRLVKELKEYLSNPPTFSPDEKYLVIDYGGSYQLWNLTQPTITPQMIQGGGIEFSHESKYIVTHDPSTMYIWEPNKESPLFEIPFTEGSTYRFSPDNTYLAVAGDDKTALYKLTDDEPEKPFRVVSGIAPKFNQKSTFVVTSTIVLDLNTNKPISEDHSEDFLIAENPDGNIMAIYGDKGATVWDIRAQTPSGEALKGHIGFIDELIFSPDGNILATLGGDGIVLTDISNPIAEQQIGPLIHGSSISFSPDGNLIAVTIGNAGSQQTAVWDISDKNNIHSIQTIPGMNGSFGPLGTYLVTHTSMDENSVLVWNVKERNFETPEARINGTYSKFSADGSLLVVFDRKVITGQSSTSTGPSTLWNMQTLTKIADVTFKSQCNDPSQNCEINAEFSADARILAYTDGKDVFLWDTKESQQFGVIHHTSRIKKLSFVFGGIFERTSATDDLQSSVLVIGGDDNSFTLWEMPSKVQVSYPIPGEFIGEISDSNKHTLVYRSLDTNQLISWDFNPANWIDVICTKAGRNLTEKEWSSYFDLPYPANQEAATCPQWPLDTVTTP